MKTFAPLHLECITFVFQNIKNHSKIFKEMILFVSSQQHMIDNYF